LPPMGMTCEFEERWIMCCSMGAHPKAASL
jgi:hypothetical protein